VAVKYFRSLQKLMNPGLGRKTSQAAGEDIDVREGYLAWEPSYADELVSAMLIDLPRGLPFDAGFLLGLKLKPMRLYQRQGAAA
jgi:hypothetical protein